MSAPWFDPAALLWIGPVAGTLEAAWGGLLGILAYALARRGRGHRIVFVHLYIGLGAAAALITSGLLARLQGQPVAISGALLGMGAPLLVAAAFSLITFSRIQRAAELRRMRAMDL